MALIYLAGLISGVILIVIALAGWIGYAAHRIADRQQNGTQDRPRHSTVSRDTGTTPVASNVAHLSSRRRRSAPPAA